MTIITIHYINLENNTSECTEKMKTLKNFNHSNKKTIKNFEKEFMKNYSDVIIPPKEIELDFETIS